MSTKEAELQARNLADLMRRSGLADVRVNGSTISYPLAEGHVLLKVSTDVRRGAE